MKKLKVCSACNKKRTYMFEVGREGSGLLGCLPCVKDCNARLLCDTCNEIIGLTDGHSSIAFCQSCYNNSDEASGATGERQGPRSCHKCNVELAYAPDGFECVKVFCLECMRKKY